MSGTQGNFVSDVPFAGGWIIYSAIDLTSFSPNLVLTRNALGDYSLNRAAAGAETYPAVIGINGAIKRLTVYPQLSSLPFLQQFGTGAGTAGYPKGAAGIPPFTGSSQFTPPTGPPPKGVRITDVCAVYQVGVVNLTAASLSLNRTAYANNVANSITNVPIAATALPLTAAGDATGPYFVKRAVTTPVFETVDQSDLLLELSVTLANTGTIRIYALGFHLDFNYN